MTQGRLATLMCRSLATVLIGGLLVACSDADSQTSAQSGLTVVPLFGTEAVDVTADVDWFGSRLGKVENVRTSTTGEVTGYDFSERLRSYSDDNVFPLAEGEIGVALSFNGYTHHGQYQLPAADGESQRLEVPVTDVARLVLDATNLSDDASMELRIENSTGSAGSASGWANLKGNFYTLPGTITVTLINKDTGQEQSEELTVSAGDTVPVTFDFAN